MSAKPPNMVLDKVDKRHIWVVLRKSYIAR